MIESMTPLPDPFTRGDVVRKSRKKQGWTQQQLAHRAHLNKATIARAERNNPKVTEDSWIAIAVALGLQPETVLLAGEAGSAVTSPVTTVGQAPTINVPLVFDESGDMVEAKDTPKTRLAHLVASLDEMEAAKLLPVVRKWFAHQINDTPNATGDRRRDPPSKSR